MGIRRSAPAVSIIAVALAASACGATAAAPLPSPPPSASAVAPLPAGWRWESYGQVEVAVPGEWGWGNSSQRLRQWCVGRGAGTPPPVVGRSGPTTLVGCEGGGGPRPETLLANTGIVVGFDRATAADGVEHEGDRTTVRLAGVEVIVQAPAELRQQIVATVHRVAADSNGCPATHPIGGQPRWRPEVHARLTGVTAVAVCKYQLADPTTVEGRPGGLLSSGRLAGPAADQALREVAKAPAGSGPNAPGTCAADVSYGEEAIVLRVESSAGLREVVVRYAGCDHHGFDDGGTVRTLTAKAVAPFLTGGNAAIGTYSSPELAEILTP